METRKKDKSFWTQIPDKAWMLLSLAVAVLLWIFIASTEAGGVVFAEPWEVFAKLVDKVSDGTLWQHTYISLFRVIAGFSLGFVISIPIAFLMGWYAPFRNLVAPWVDRKSVV